MRQVNKEEDFIANPRSPVPSREEYTKFKVGDRVTFTMPWMGGRDVLVTAKVKEIDPHQVYAELELLGFWGGTDDTAIEMLQCLTAYTKEDQEYEDTFKDDTPRPPDEGWPPELSVNAKKEQENK
jgi:hypothetical protein